MKKVYINPEISVMDVEMEESLMTVSGTGFKSGDASDELPVLSRDSFWDAE